MGAPARGGAAGRRRASPRVREGDYSLKDSRGNEVGKGKIALNALGGFELALALPPTMNLGQAALLLTAGGTAHLHAFEVQEFRRPEFEVTASASEGPHFVGGHATVTAAAAYYAGGALPGAPVSWRVAASLATFTPPNRDDWTFGEWVPWWEPPGRREPERVLEFAAETDASGRHRLRIDLERGDPPRPRQVRAEASVTDVNRQAWTAAATLLVHPGSLYVGLRSERLFVEPGQPLRIDAIVTDLDGRAVPGKKLVVLAERLDWEQEAGEWKEKAVDPQSCPLVSAAEGVRCTFKTPEGGTYRVTARVEDDAQRPNETRLRLWVAGGKTPPRRSLEQEKVTLVPDKKEYRAGDVARVLVLAPFAPAEGVVTLRRSGLLRQERFRMTGSSHTLEVRIEDALVPNLHVQVDLVGRRPAHERIGRGRCQAAAPARLRERARSTCRCRPTRGRSGSRSRRGSRPWRPAARRPWTSSSATPTRRRSRAARWRSSSWTSRCSPSPATGCPTPWASSTPRARPACATTACARAFSSGGPRT